MRMTAFNPQKIPAIILLIGPALGICFVVGGVAVLGYVMLYAPYPFQLVAVGVAVTVGLLYFFLPRRDAVKGGEVGQKMNVQQFESTVTNRLGRLVIENNVHCTAEVIRGPFSLTYRLVVTRDVTAGIKKLMGLQNTFEMVMQSAVRVVQSQNGILIEVQLPEEMQRTPNAAKLAAYATPDRVPLGIDQFNRIVAVNPSEHGVIAWIAPPRRGKTESMKSTLYAMIRADAAMKFVVCALPAKISRDWGSFAKVRGCLGLVGDPEEMAVALKWVTDAMNAGTLEGEIVVLLDDLANLTSRVDLGSYVDEIGLAGAGLGVHLLIGTHGNGSKSAVAGSLSQNAQTCKILYKAADNMTGSRSAGRRNAETGLSSLSGRPGDGIVDINGVVTRVATAWVSDADILDLPPKRPGSERPWRVTEAAGVTSNAVTHRGAVTDVFEAVTRGRASSPSPSPVDDAPHVFTFADAARGGAAGDGDAVTVTAGMFPLESGRPLNDDEAAVIRALQKQDPVTWNATKLCELVYGTKSSARKRKVEEALVRAVANAPMTKDTAIEILSSADVNDPMRGEALAFLKEVAAIKINGKGWDEKGPSKRA